MAKYWGKRDAKRSNPKYRRRREWEIQPSDGREGEHKVCTEKEERRVEWMSHPQRQRDGLWSLDFYCTRETWI